MFNAQMKTAKQNRSTIEQKVYNLVHAVDYKDTLIVDAKTIRIVKSETLKINAKALKFEDSRDLIVTDIFNLLRNL